jgi:hypothetical protein
MPGQVFNSVRYRKAVFLRTNYRNPNSMQLTGNLMEQPFKRVLKVDTFVQYSVLTFSLSSNEGIVNSIPAE